MSIISCRKCGAVPDERYDIYCWDCRACYDMSDDDEVPADAGPVEQVQIVAALQDSVAEVAADAGPMEQAQIAPAPCC